MVTIRNNQPAEMLLNYVGAVEGKIRLMPGINLGIDDIEWAAARQHPIVAYYLEAGTLEPLISDPINVSEMKTEDGRTHQVIDDKRSGQPMPITGEASRRWTPSQQQLIDMKGIGPATSRRIIDSMPEGGYTSLAQVQELNPDLMDSPIIDWVQVEEAIALSATDEK